MKTAALIYNPRAGSWRTEQRIAAIQFALERAGFTVEARPTEAPGHATVLAVEAAEAGLDAVFAHGGDGTLREAAAGLLGSPTALAPIPGGTVNVIATALGLPHNPVRAAHAMSEVEAVDMDVGLCGDEVFLMQASAGLDAHVMGQLRPGLKRHFGKLAVAYAGLMNFSTYKYPPIDLRVDGRHLSATLIAVCNLPYYAGTWQMAPGADIADRVLDLVLFHGRGGLKTLAFARDFIFGKHLDRPDVDLVRTQEVEIRGPADLAMQLDGDTLPIELPVSITLHPQRLRILRPLALPPRK